MNLDHNHVLKMLSLRHKSPSVTDEYFRESNIADDGTCLDTSRHTAYVPDPYIKYEPSYEVVDQLYR